MVDPFHITADEINCLIYAYFKDSGFQHSAFVLRAEGRLEHSPHYKKHVPRGELVELLSKALLFAEVEAHWKGDNMTLNCTNQFKLLEPHVCSYDPNLPPPPLPEPQRIPMKHVNLPPTSQVNGPIEGSLKRKASNTPHVEERPKEKRAKTTFRDGHAAVDGENISAGAKSSAPNALPVAADGATVATDMTRTSSNESSASLVSGEQTDGAVQLLNAHKTEVFVCAWNPVNNATLASGSKDGIVHIWNVPGPDQDGVVSTRIETPLTCAYPANSTEGDLTSLAWSPDGSLIAVGCYDSVLRICDSKGMGYFTQAQHDGPIFSVRFSPSGRWLVSASLDGSACIWDVKEKKLHKQFSVHKQCCLDVDWLSDSQFITSGSDGIIYIMGVDSSKPVKTLVGHESEVNQVKCSPSRKKIASSSDDRTGRIWNVEEFASVRRINNQCIVLTGHKGPVSNIAWCPLTSHGEHELVATSSFDGTSRLWDSVTGECLRTFNDHKLNVYALAFSPDGRNLATGGKDGYLHIYDVRAKEKRWSWSVGTSKPGIFEIVWQQAGNLNRIGMAMEKHTVGVVDLSRIPELQ